MKLEHELIAHEDLDSFHLLHRPPRSPESRRRWRKLELGLFGIAFIALLGSASLPRSGCDSKPVVKGGYAVCRDEKANVLHLYSDDPKGPRREIKNATHVLLTEDGSWYYYTGEGNFIDSFSQKLPDGEPILYAHERK